MEHCEGRAAPQFRLDFPDFHAYCERWRSHWPRQPGDPRPRFSESHPSTKFALVLCKETGWGAGG